jgi:16S rRNA (adenine1518-N6/adenine1519-N6)-dimethyltransferase
MHHPRKRFGQHFLSDQVIIQRIVAALNPQRDDHLIEIGPGQGAMTVPVLKQAGHLEVVELDRDLIPELQERNRSHAQLIVHEADALAFNFGALKKDARKLRVFGNLPYNISTPLIFHLLTFAADISDMLFMLQKEVADRLAAQPNDDAYGRLSVMVQYHCAVDILFDVPPSAFFPPPKVDSSIIRLIPYPTLPHTAKDYHRFETIVKQAFGQRRKTLRNSLKGMIDDAAFLSANIQSNLRAENLTVADFVRLSNVCI